MTSQYLTPETGKTYPPADREERTPGYHETACRCFRTYGDQLDFRLTRILATGSPSSPQLSGSTSSISMSGTLCMG